jgi:putative transposase
VARDVDKGVRRLDGGKTVREAVNGLVGIHTPVQRCVRHKERNILEHLPEHQRDTVRRRLRAAWARRP